jgi:hypothetical protein
MWIVHSLGDTTSDGWGGACTQAGKTTLKSWFFSAIRHQRMVTPA